MASSSTPKNHPVALFWLRLADRMERPAYWLGTYSSWLMLALAGLIAFDAFGRRYIRTWSFVVEQNWHVLINSPVFQDGEWHLHTIVTFCALGYAHVRHADVRLDLFRPGFKPKTKLWIEWVGGLILFLPFMVIFCFYAFKYFNLAWVIDESAGDSNGIHHRWFIKFFIFLGPLSLLAAGAASMIRLTVRLFGPKTLHSQTNTEHITAENHSAYS
jgi:TRAP-type mannitol/chloroaromatic compound transport system permease small subunit